MGGVAWSEEEDHLLRKCIEQYGEGKWHRVPLLAGLNRCRKSCRLRWLNYLRPNIKRGSFADEEVDLIIKLHKILGNRWSLIAGRLPGRTANDVKNYWNCHLSKRLSAQELEEKNRVPTNVGATGPQPLNFDTNSLTPKSPDQDHPNYLLQPPPEEESGSTSTPILQQVVEEGMGQSQSKALQKEEEYNNYPGIEDHGFVSDLGMDFGFEDVKVTTTSTCDGRESSSCKWEWDDLILDMDLWSESL